MGYLIEKQTQAQLALKMTNQLKTYSKQTHKRLSRERKRQQLLVFVWPANCPISGQEIYQKRIYRLPGKKHAS